jgi:hypothetical protein
MIDIGHRLADDFSVCRTRGKASDKKKSLVSKFFAIMHGFVKMKMHMQERWMSG